MTNKPYSLFLENLKTRLQLIILCLYLARSVIDLRPFGYEEQ